MSEAPEKAPSRTGNLITPLEDPRDQVSVRKKKKRSYAPLKIASSKAYLALVILTLAVFAPIFGSDVLWSDYDLTQRSAYEAMEHWTDAWQVKAIRNDDPITLTSYFLEQSLPFPTAIVHRAINLLLHLIAAILLLKNLEALKVPAAFSATLVFALHPAVVQTIFWAGYRTEIVGLILILSALKYGILNRGSTDYMKMLGLSALACLIHPLAVTIPLILCLTIIYQEKALRLHLFNRVLPLLCIALFIGVWTQVGDSTDNSEKITETVVFLNHAGQNMYFFIEQTFLPLSVALFHPMIGTGYKVGTDISMLPFVLFIPFYILLLIYYKRRWSRVILFGLTTYLALSLYGISTSGAFIDGNLAYENHRQYVALPAIIAFIVCSAGHLARILGATGKSFWAIGLSVVLLIETMITGSYTYAIGEPTRMWQSMTKQWPDSWVPKVALIDRVIETDSDLLNEVQRITMLETILEAKPDLYKQRIRLVRAYVKAEQNTNALREYGRILRETTPDDAFLEEAAQFYDKVGLNWEAITARERMQTTPSNIQ
jgi:hypothetical protein